jgi:type II secretory pathway component GspD/PulD (secretin)
MLGNIDCVAETIIEVIQVNNRPAAEIQPLLKPLLDESDQVIADGSNLLIKTSPERLAEIKAFVNKLDSRQQNLLITVLQSSQMNADELNAAARARISIPADNISKTTSIITGHVYQTQGDTTRENTQTIRTLEGNTAYIKTGNAQPVQNIQIFNSGYGYPAVTANTKFIETSTGFAVIPRLNGEQVTLDVTPWSEHMARGQIQSQSAQSSLRVNLGEWVELGGISENSQYSSSSRLANVRQTGNNQMHILVKVEKVN